MKALLSTTIGVLALLSPLAVFADPGHGIEVGDSLNFLHYITSHGVGVIMAGASLIGVFATYKIYRAIKAWKKID